MKYLIFFLLCGCAANHVTLPTKSEFAPKDYEPIGVVSYLNQGADFVINSRREDAYKKMYMVCRGSYKILSEGEKSDGGSSQFIPGTNSIFHFESNYWYITYKCIEKEDEVDKDESPQQVIKPSGP